MDHHGRGSCYVASVSSMYPPPQYVFRWIGMSHRSSLNLHTASMGADGRCDKKQMKKLLLGEEKLTIANKTDNIFYWNMLPRRPTRWDERDVVDLDQRFEGAQHWTVSRRFVLQCRMAVFLATISTSLAKRLYKVSITNLLHLETS